MFSAEMLGSARTAPLGYVLRQKKPPLLPMLVRLVWIGEFVLQFLLILVLQVIERESRIVTFLAVVLAARGLGNRIDLGAICR